MKNLISLRGAVRPEGQGAGVGRSEDVEAVGGSGVTDWHSRSRRKNETGTAMTNRRDTGATGGQVGGLN